MEARADDFHLKPIERLLEPVLGLDANLLLLRLLFCELDTLEAGLTGLWYSIRLCDRGGGDFFFLPLLFFVGEVCGLKTWL